MDYDNYFEYLLCNDAREDDATYAYFASCRAVRQCLLQWMRDSCMGLTQLLLLNDDDDIDDDDDDDDDDSNNNNN